MFASSGRVSTTLYHGAIWIHRSFGSRWPLWPLRLPAAPMAPGSGDRSSEGMGEMPSGGTWGLATGKWFPQVTMEVSILMVVHDLDSWK